MRAACARTRRVAMRLQHFLFVRFIKDPARRTQRGMPVHKTNKLIYKRFSHERERNAIAHRDRLREQKDTRLKFRFHRIRCVHFIFVLRFW